jgi:hypothetical protein
MIFLGELMKKNYFFTLGFLGIISLHSNSYAIDLESLSKVYHSKGTHSSHGEYESQTEVKVIDSQIKITKIISYQNFKFENLAIEEVWEGSGQINQDQLKVIFLLKKADFLKTAEGLERTASMFKEKEEVLIETNSLELGSQIDFERKDESFSEKIISISETANTPLWENVRQKSLSYGKESSLLIKAAVYFLKKRVFDWFHQDPLVKAWEHKEEYQSKMQYFITDLTDYKFYQANPKKLRVVNKIPDTISLIESIQRRNAFAPTLHEKQNHFDERMQKLHINELGLFSSAELDEKGNVKRFLLDDDSALWTGMYVASEAMKYKVTGDAIALKNIKRSLKGIMFLMDVTNDPKNFARSAAIHDGSITLNSKFHLYETKDSKPIVWSSVGNNDMFKGLIHSFIWTYLVLPESEKELKNNLKTYMQRIADLNVANQLQNKVPALGLRALVTGNKDDLEGFFKAHAIEQIPGKLLNVEGSTHVGGVVDWSGVNLGMVGTISDLLITKELIKKFPEEEKLKETYSQMQRALMLQWKDLRTTKRHFLTIAAHTFAMNEGFSIQQANEWGDELTRKELKREWSKAKEQSLISLIEIPIHRSAYDVSYDFSLKPDWSISWWPVLPWKSVKDKKEVTYHIQGAYAYPLFESFGMGSNFIWKDQAFVYRGGSNKSIKAPGTDYLYSYWMARLGGLL